MIAWKMRGLYPLTALLLLGGLACSLFTTEGIPDDAVVVDVLANSSVANWLSESAASFNDADFETSAGRPIHVQVSATESGQAVSALAAGRVAPDLWVPDDRVWANVAADQGVADYQNDCVSLAESPLVIAMWEPVAESLGWPGRELGWLDIGSLAADQTAWRYYSGGQYGDSLRLGHTHPGLSASGASTLLAIVQAAQSKVQAVSVSEIQQPIVQASVGAFEGAVSWFSSDTDSLGATMSARGLDFLGAAVMYESTVIQHSQSESGTRLVPIYPFEGTFVASHPACLNRNADASRMEAAQIFRDYLLSEEAQGLAQTPYGLRPVTGQESSSTTLPASVDYEKPENIFASPSVDSLYAVQEVWQAARKDVNLVMLIDVSGSMGGSKIANVRTAATTFVEQMNDDDFLTLVTFSHDLSVIVNHERIGSAREKIVQSIQLLTADGDTALYDAIGLGAELIEQSDSPDVTNAMVVLTDGIDTVSSRYRFDTTLINAASSNDTTIFTIAYGNDADEVLLRQLAEQAFGNYYQGSEADIAGIYEEMAAAFGGNLGVGR